MVQLTNFGENLIDARQWHIRLKKEHPKYADRARDIVLRYFKKYMPEKVEAFLGRNEDDVYETPRYYYYYLQRELCDYLKDIEDYQTPDNPMLDYKIKWDHHIRHRLFLPLRIVEEDTIEEIEKLLMG